MKNGDLAALGIQARNRKVREALIRARRHLDIHERAVFARLLNAANNFEGPDESTYNRWEHEVEDEEEGRRGRIIPGWALDVAAEVAGVTVDSLLGTGKLEPNLVQHMGDMEERLQVVLGELRQLLPLKEELKRLRRAERARERRRSTAANG